MNEQTLESIRAEYQGRKKSVGVMYLLMIFFGTFGAHKLYVHELTAGFLQLFLFWGGILMTSTGFGFILLVMWGIWIFINIFTNPSAVNHYNWNLHSDIIRREELGIK